MTKSQCDFNCQLIANAAQIYSWSHAFENCWYTISIWTNDFRKKVERLSHIYSSFRSTFIQIVWIQLNGRFETLKLAIRYLFEFFIVFLFEIKFEDAFIWQFVSSFVFYWFNITQFYLCAVVVHRCFSHRFLFVCVCVFLSSSVKFLIGLWSTEKNFLFLNKKKLEEITARTKKKKNKSIKIVVKWTGYLYIWMWVIQERRYAFFHFQRNKKLAFQLFLIFNAYLIWEVILLSVCLVLLLLLLLLPFRFI